LVGGSKNHQPTEKRKDRLRGPTSRGRRPRVRGRSSSGTCEKSSGKGISSCTQGTFLYWGGEKTESASSAGWHKVQVLYGKRAYNKKPVRGRAACKATKKGRHQPRRNKTQRRGSASTERLIRLTRHPCLEIGVAGGMIRSEEGSGKNTRARSLSQGQGSTAQRHHSATAQHPEAS